MHKFLRSIGFSTIRKRAEMREIICDVVKNCDEKIIVEDHEDGAFAEFSKNYGSDCGITVCGQFDDNHKFRPDDWFPYFKGAGITSEEDVIIEQHAAKESFAGACDAFRIGVTLIFYLQNAAEYMIEEAKDGIEKRKKGLLLYPSAAGGVFFLLMQVRKV